MVDRQAIRKRLQYIKKAQREHVSAITRIAGELMELKDLNPSYLKVIDALMVLAQTLEISAQLCEKILEEI
jgi:hypothetical protein